MADLKRLNTNISKEIYDWIDEESKRTGVLKSTIIYTALKTYMDQQQMLYLTKLAKQHELNNTSLHIEN